MANPPLPFKNFRFVVYFPGSKDPVAGISKVSMLKRTTEVISHRSGGDNGTPTHSPGSTKFEPITLERGVTNSRDFEKWANLIYTDAEGRVATAPGYKQNLTIEVRNLAGQAVVKYTVKNAWVSEYVALPDLDANANAVALEHIILQNEGWERQEKPEPPSADAELDG